MCIVVSKYIISRFVLLDQNQILEEFVFFYFLSINPTIVYFVRILNIFLLLSLHVDLSQIKPSQTNTRQPHQTKHNKTETNQTKPTPANHANPNQTKPNLTKQRRIIKTNTIHIFSYFLFNYKSRDNTNKKNHNLLCSSDPPNQSRLF